MCKVEKLFSTDGRMGESVQDDVNHIQKYYRDFFSSFDIVSRSEHSVEFHFTAEERGETRHIQVVLNPNSFVVKKSVGVSLEGQEFETIEQLLNKVCPTSYPQKLQYLIEAKLKQGNE